MLKIESQNWELPQIGKEPAMGFADEYAEYVMVSGLVKRIYKGRRFYATFSYGFLTDEQRAKLNDLLVTQRLQGYLNVEISSPYGQYIGAAILEVNQDQKRFKYNKETGEYVWINWSITLKAVSYDN